MKKVNEENACNAFIEILEKITCVEYEKENSPDEQSNKFSEVDYILISKDGQSHRIAVEHTTVESFEKQIAYVNQSYDVVSQINFQCKGSLPTDHYYILVVPPSFIGSLKRKRKKKFVKDISFWILDVAKTLHADQCCSRIYNDEEVILTCGGSHPEMNGNVVRIPTQPMEVERLKRERFRRSIKDKLPRLIRYKVKRFTTALLLEDISGVLRDYQARWKNLSIIQRLFIRIFVDYVVIFFSNNQKMIVGNVWKEKRCLYSTIPYNRKFSLH